MGDLLAAVRKACLPAIWSQGAKLARENAVAHAGAPGEYRVKAPGLAIAPTVTLYPEDEEWSCDCGGRVDPCAHVAAATIAVAQGTLAAAAPTTAVASLAYRFSVRDRRLSLSRALVGQDGGEEKLTGSLASRVARATLPRGLSPTHEDLRLDRIFGETTREAVPLARMAEVLEALSSAPVVTLDGKAIKTSGDAVRPRAVVEDEASGGFMVRIERDPRVTDVVAMGVVRLGDVLRPIAEAELTGEWLEQLPLVRRVNDLSELAAKIVPELEKRIEVEVRTRRLPQTAKRVRPRIDLDLSHQGHALSILPTLVYGEPTMARVDGDRLVVIAGDVVPERRRDVEHELVFRLRDRLNLVPGRRVHFDGAEAISFAAKLRAWQETEDGTSTFAEARTLVPRVIVDGDRFDVSFEIAASSGGSGEGSALPPSRADTAGVLRAFRAGLDLVPTGDGGWATLPREWLAKHGDRVADLLAARDASEKVPTAALPVLGDLLQELDMPPPMGLSRLAPLLAGGGAMPQATLPADLDATLRDYQRHGVDWLSFLRDAHLGGVLADDMGLGKTVQTIAALRGRSLVVCPKSVVYNWAAAIARFRPSQKVAIYHGQKRELDETADVTLTTYAVLRLDVERLEKVRWDAVVLDEAQAIKNETSQTARSAFRLQGDFRVALSGTPVENRLEELWSLMFFTTPGLLGGRSDFRDRVIGPVQAGEAGAAERLRAKIRPFVLRRLKRDVLTELPPRTDQVLYVELDERERVVYDAVRAATKQDVVDKLAQGGGVLAALEALLRLRQAASHSALVPGQRADGSAKIERLMEALAEAAADGHKALVFSQWTGFLDLVEPHLTAAAIPFVRLDGSTRDRGSVVSQFQDEKGPPVMLVSLKAGGTGLNLTAADHVFLLDPWWNPAVEDQAADRAHRIGQDRPVMVYRLVAKDTVEERILTLKEKKRGLADVALGGAEAAGAITKDDLLALLE